MWNGRRSDIVETNFVCSTFQKFICFSRKCPEHKKKTNSVKTVICEVESAKFLKIHDVAHLLNADVSLTLRRWPATNFGALSKCCCNGDVGDWTSILDAIDDVDAVVEGGWFVASPNPSGNRASNKRSLLAIAFECDSECNEVLRWLFTALPPNSGWKVDSLGGDVWWFLVGVLSPAPLCCRIFGFAFNAYGDTGVVDGAPSKFGSVAWSTCGDGEVTLRGDGLDGSTRGRFCVDTLPLGRCRGATLVPTSVCCASLEITDGFCKLATRFSSLSNGGVDKFSNTGASVFYREKTKKKINWS